jgi:hypothetical protein
MSIHVGDRGTSVPEENGAIRGMMSLADARAYKARGVVVCTPGGFPIGVLHPFDYPFCHFDIRENVYCRCVDTHVRTMGGTMTVRRLIVILASALLCGPVFVAAGCGSTDTATTLTTQTVQLYRVCVDGKWGYIDSTGAVKIEPRFDAAYDFSEGLAAVDVAYDDGSGFGYIDTSGEMVIEQQFPSAETFSEGLAAVGTVDQGDGGKWGSIDTSGTLVVPMQYVTPPVFSEGLAAVFSGVDQGWAFIDKTGATVLGPFRAAGNFSEGLAYVDWADGRGYIDKEGDRVIELPEGFASVRWPEAGFSEGLAMVESQEGEVILAGFIDTSGNWAIEPRFQWAGTFSEGLAAAAIQIGGEMNWGYIDKTGDWLIKPQFDSVSPFSEGLAVVMHLENDGAGNDRETFGYIDKTGTVVIPLQYSEVSGFSGGIAAVVFRDARNGLPNYIDNTGKVIWQGE